jgi:hypothetical protein
MPFERAKQRAPVAVGNIRINLGDLPATADTPATKKITYHLELLDADGQIVTTQGGDLRPHLTGPQLNALSNFLDAMRVKAVEALPQ